MSMLKCHHPLLLNMTAKSQYASGQRDKLKCILSIMEIYIALWKRCIPHKATGHVFSLDIYMISSSFYYPHYNQGFPGDSDGKESACRRPGFDPWVRKIPWRMERQPDPVFLPRKSHRRRSLVGYSPWGRRV